MKENGYSAEHFIENYLRINITNIHLFCKHLIRPYCFVAVIVLSSEYTVVSKTYMVSSFLEHKEHLEGKDKL